MGNGIKRIEELCERANAVVKQILMEGDDRLWYVYDALSAELYQMVMWYNTMSDVHLFIRQDGDCGEPFLFAEDSGRVFDLYQYTIYSQC